MKLDSKCLPNDVKGVSENKPANGFHDKSRDTPELPKPRQLNGLADSRDRISLPRSQSPMVTLLQKKRGEIIPYR